MRTASFGVGSLSLMGATWALAAAIIAGQVDSFEDGSTQGWSIGPSGSSLSIPRNVADGGPGGAGDNYLEARSTGSFGPGGKLVVFNAAQWAGNYTAADVTVIRLSANNFGATDLELRLAFDGAGGRFSSTAPVVVPAGSGWQTVTFPIRAGDLTAVEGGTNAAATLGNVSVLRLLHAPAPTFSGPPDVAAVLGVDNVTAGPVPLPVELVAFDALVDGAGVVLRWATASETDNAGFAVETRAGGSWRELAFVAGHGTTAERHVYAHAVGGLLPGRHAFRLRQVDTDGAARYSSEVEAVVGAAAFAVRGPFPNPVGGRAELVVEHPRAGHVRAALYDALGREVTVAFDGVLPEGSHWLRFGTGDLPVGVYVVHATSGATAVTRRLTVVR